ncbi:SWI/SNF complex protein (SWIB/MDM2 domain-containing protein) [Phlyctema vagabunda]|uniref:SWI/SNF complex protein (SWIB/MDM2 domain-containing protein) n=1 Tax=Phlyctema vagabunda TaxID=108571 RepID=A0ABR4PD03_9HELO
MQPGYRPFPQQPPQRSPHAATTRRGIGPMISGAQAQNPMTPAQLQAQQQMAHAAQQAARLKSRKPTDKNIPEGVEEHIVGDGVQRYRDLREIERRLDSTMTRKRLDIQDAVNRQVKRYRTLRVWISNTVEDQPWQADGLDIDAFDFSTNMDSSYRVKIEGRLLDEEEDAHSDDSDDEDESENPDAMDEDGKEKKKTSAIQYKLSHFFKAMTVDFDRNRAKDGSEQNVEWKKPVVAPNSTNLPNAADFDQLEFKRGGDENINITINLTRDETPERFALSPALAEILDAEEGTRAEVMMGIWDYIRAMGLQEDDEKRSFRCDEHLRLIMGRDIGYIPYIGDAINPHLTTLPPVKLAYTVRVDPDFHKDPQPTIYDIRVSLDDPLRAAYAKFLTDPSYAQTLREIESLNNNLSILIQAISQSKSKHAFLDTLSRNPTEFIAKWLSSQKRDLEIMAGEATRGGGEDATGEEWRKGGSSGIWGSDNVRESVNLMVGARPRV